MDNMRMELDQHLIATTHPVANEANLVYWKNYRITVLQDRLFRIEQSCEGVFRDDATLAVWYRDMPPQTFQMTFTGEEAIIDTGVCALILRKERNACRIRLGGKLLKIDNRGNLKGTYRTLDGCNADIRIHKGEQSRIRLEDGVCSKSGIAVLRDSGTPSLLKNGQIAPCTVTERDEYVFAYGDDYRAAVNALYLITGRPPVIPRFAFGNWWSRYYAYTDEEYLRTLNLFDEHNVPLTVATIDMDWHYSTTVDADFRITEQNRNIPELGGNSGWTGYTWNKTLFPDYKKFLTLVNDRGLKITLNLHPAQGIRWWEESYAEMSTVLGHDSGSLRPIAFDLSDPAFVNAYFSVLHKPYEREGVQFWWIDWQQGTKTSIDGLDPLWALNHYHYLDNAKENVSPLILSRYAGIGSHRYPLGFSGDTHITWATLKYLPYFTATASNCGYTWWSHDIGGHMLGTQSGELFVRHLQFGVFSPINRLHSSDSPTTSKEPWLYGNGAGQIAEEWLRLRHKLIPFLYTASHRTMREGRALIEPLYYEWKQEEAFAAKTEYLFGDTLLVAPVAEPRKADGFAHINIWLPEGTWTDIFTSDEYVVPAGGRRLTVCRGLETIPVFARAGAILPLSAEKGNSVANPRALEILVFKGNGEYTLIEDVEEGDGKAETHFVSAEHFSKVAGEQSLTMSGATDREVLVRFSNIKDGKIKLYIDGKETACQPYLTDWTAVKFAMSGGHEYRVVCEYSIPTPAEALLVRAERILLRAEGDYKAKWEAWEKLRKIKTKDEYRALVENCELPGITKQRLLETVAFDKI